MRKKAKQSTKATSAAAIGRRSFMGTLAAAAGTSAVAGTLSSFAPSANAETVHFAANTPGMGGGGPFRAKCEIRDCEVEARFRRA